MSATAIEYMFTKFVFDSSNRFPFRARTNRHTDSTKHHTHAGGYTVDVGNKDSMSDDICQINDNLYSPLRQKQYAKYKRIKNYKTQPKTVGRQIYTM